MDLRAIAGSTLLATGLLLLGGENAGAALPPSDARPSPPSSERVLGALGVPGCACSVDLLELERYRALIAAAPDAREGRALATRPSRLARRALGAARLVAPGSRSIGAAHSKLVAYERRVARAATPAEAAREFEGLVRLAGDVAVSTGKGGCNYDTTEIIAIILGFLLFIIPGIILLIVFC